MLYYLIRLYALGGKSGVKRILGVKTEPKKIKKPKKVVKRIQKLPKQPMVVYGGSGGKGGGRPDMAMAGGKDVSKIQNAMKQVIEIRKMQLASRNYSKR